MENLPEIVRTLLFVFVAIVHAAAVVAVLLSREREPSATMAWLLVLFLAPGVGLVVYVLLGRTRARRTERRCAAVDDRVRSVLARHEVHERIGDASVSLEIPGHVRSVLTLAGALASTPASRGNQVKVLRDAAVTYEEMRRAIVEARDHIHVQFYIYQPDEVGRALRDLLVARAREGLRVRVLVDGIGSYKLPGGFWRPLVEAGGSAAEFNPVHFRFLRFARRDRIDFRNHRKILIVDGHTAFTGGINVGKEYLGLDPSVGHWRDTHVRIDGPAAMSAQHAFIQDWLHASDELCEHERYFPALPDERPEEPGSVVQIVDSGPDQAWRGIALVQQHAIELARQRVWITNPYFVPSQTLRDTLVSAALRGVDVRLLLPSRSDNRLVSAASKSYYLNLLEAGVRIYEYERGFVHAKTLVVDDWMGVVGSANMDLRSFNLNFEINAFIFEKALPAKLAEHYRADIAVAREISEQSVQEAGLATRVGLALARLLSPLL